MEDQEEVLKETYDKACDLLSSQASIAELSCLFDESETKLTRPSLIKKLESYKIAFCELAEIRY